ncbi:hypothetical protein [Streptomyces sp. NPDC087270]|uniref:hypothetical protein n=1 Tax=Streptomyces sp. NPDC087270 TaxID=3365774 RepID=UPI003820B573
MSERGTKRAGTGGFDGPWKQELLSAGQLDLAAQPIPELPVPELFRRAWQRVLDGDPPAFEKFAQRRTGRGRR